jgi:hypothetical protein
MHPPLHLLLWEEKRTVLPSPETRRNQELSPCTGTCRGAGSMTAPHMEHGAKPPGSFLSTPCFLPIKCPGLQPPESIVKRASKPNKRSPQPFNSYLCKVFCLLSLISPRLVESCMSPLFLFLEVIGLRHSAQSKIPKALYQAE